MRQLNCIELATHVVSGGLVVYYEPFEPCYASADVYWNQGNWSIGIGYSNYYQPVYEVIPVYYEPGYYYEPAYTVTYIY